LSKELVANLPKVGNGEENKIEQEITETRLQSTSVKMGRGQDPPSKTGCNKDYLARLEQLDNERLYASLPISCWMGAYDKIERFPFWSENCRLASTKQAYTRLFGKKFGKHRMGVSFQ